MHIERNHVQRLIDLVTKAGSTDARELVEADGGWLNQLAVRPGYTPLIAVPPGVPLHIYDALHELYREIGDRKLQIVVNQIIQAAKAPEHTKCTRLQSFPEMARMWLEQHGDRGWVYKLVGGRMVPYLFQSAKYEETDRPHNVPARVHLSFVAYSPYVTAGDHRTGVMLQHLDINGKTVGQVLAEKSDLIPESAELNEAHDRACDKYVAIAANNLKQHRCAGVGSFREGYRVNTAELTGEKVIIDIGKQSPQTSVTSGLLSPLGSLPVPFHPIIPFFHLGRHQMMSAHALDLELYEWRDNLGSKLVLSAEHADLIEVLTEDGDVLSEDIVEGKSGGTVVLCKGPPGVGKTLTAEVYSEVTRRPLYRVHSGQLGVDPKSVESELVATFDRAKRYNAVLLIDEADVFVRTRGDNVMQNALTSVFLRMMEYWDGLLFMTTNRSDDIDDAIISRCMAVISYTRPELTERRALWRILAKQFDVPLTDALCDQLAAKFDALSGRDIKGILRLTKRYAERRRVTYTVELFSRMATFRGA